MTKESNLEKDLKQSIKTNLNNYIDSLSTEIKKENKNGKVHFYKNSNHSIFKNIKQWITRKNNQIKLTDVEIDDINKKIKYKINSK